MGYADLCLRLPELLLMRVDKMSMATGLECRVPFLDHKFVQFAMGIPEAVKTRGGELKHILKKAARGRIPDEIIDRRKQGFGVPVWEWFDDRLGELAQIELKNFAQETGLLNWDKVEELMRVGRSPQVWYLLNAALWWKEFIR